MLKCFILIPTGELQVLQNLAISSDSHISRKLEALFFKGRFDPGTVMFPVLDRTALSLKEELGVAAGPRPLAGRGGNTGQEHLSSFQLVS